MACSVGKVGVSGVTGGFPTEISVVGTGWLTVGAAGGTLMVELSPGPAEVTSGGLEGLTGIEVLSGVAEVSSQS